MTRARDVANIDGLLTTKGDIYAATAAATPARLAVGNNGDTLVADSSTSTGLRYQGSTAAAKNRIINGAMDFWQRNTSFGPTAATGIFSADRWYTTLTANTMTSSRETSIVPTGFEYAFKMTAGTGGSGMWMYQYIESQNCQDLAGKTVTLSAYCATSNSSSVDFIVNYNTAFDAAPAGGGWTAAGSTTVITTTSTMPSAPQTAQFAIPSTAKTLQVLIRTNGNVAAGTTLTVTGVQLELGSVATAFSRAGGTIQGELAAAQRYYWRFGGNSAAQTFGVGSSITATLSPIYVQSPVAMRTTPTSIDYANLQVTDQNTYTLNISNLIFNNAGTNGSVLNATHAGNATAYRPAFIVTSGTNGYLGFSAEL
jgi:hypothetical protein